MVRLLAFVRHADPLLVFAKGLSDADEPDLWQKDLTGAIDLWVEVGQPDERRMLKACGRARQVVVYSYGSTSAIWWSQIGNRVERARNLAVYNIANSTSTALEAMAQRSMQLQCTVQDSQIWISNGEQPLQIDFTVLKALG